MNTLLQSSTSDPSFVLDAVGLTHLLKKEQIYPFCFSGSEPPSDAMDAYFSWVQHMKIAFDRDSLPWVPAGLVGPCLVVAHYDPEECKATFPISITQRTFVSKDDYFKILNAVSQWGNKKTSYKASPTTNHIQKHFKKPLFASKDDYLAYLLESMLLTDTSRLELEALSKKENWSLEELPQGFDHAYRKFHNAYPLIDLRNVEIDEQTEQIIPEPFSKSFHCLSFLKLERTALVAMAVWPSKHVEDLLLSRLKSEIDNVYFCYTSKEQINNKLQEISRKRSLNRKIVLDSKHKDDSQDGKGLLVIDETKVRQFDSANKNVSAEDLFKWLIWEGVNREASDIHLEQAEGRGRVRFRVDGDLYVFMEPSLDNARSLVTVAKNAFSMGSNTFDSEDAAMSILIGDQKIGLRANVIPFRKSFQNMVLRILPKSNNIIRLNQLDISEKNLNTIRRAITRKQGLILITGPTGEGKTTTLYASLTEINKPGLKIQTIEDPIEKELEGIVQTAVDVKRNITFPSLMRSIVRQDPNVVLLGEIRDRESAELAIEAADTGHLVFSTLHSNSAIKSIKRLTQLGIEPFKLADSLLLLQAQRLIKKLCVYCKKEKSLSFDEVSLFEEAKLEIPQKICEASGCKQCGNSGYMNRLAIMEMIPVDNSFAEAIIDGKSSLDLRKIANSQGHNTLYQDALLKVAEGKTSLSEAKSMEEPW